MDILYVKDSRVYLVAKTLSPRHMEYPFSLNYFLLPSLLFGKDQNEFTYNSS